MRMRIDFGMILEALGMAKTAKWSSQRLLKSKLDGVSKRYKVDAKNTEGSVGAPPIASVFGLRCRLVLKYVDTLVLR